MTKLKQLRYTTYSDPKMNRRDQGLLISLNGDEASYMGEQAVTGMEVVSKEESKKIPMGDSGTLDVKFIGTAPGGYKLKLGIRKGGVFIPFFSDTVASTSYTDKVLTLTVPNLTDTSVTMHPLIYILESGDGSQLPRTDNVKTVSGSLLYIEVSGNLPVGKSFSPVAQGTVIRTQDGNKMLYGSTSGVSTFGTTGVYTLPSGQQGYKDFYPFAIFDIPNATDGNFVYKVVADKTDRNELGLPTNAPDLIIINPALSAPVPNDEVYFDLGAGINRVAPEWSFHGAADRGATIIPASASASIFGVLEYDIPDTIKGPCIMLLSNGLPYTTSPYATGSTARERERAMVVYAHSIYVKDGPAISTPEGYREVLVDLSDVFAEPTTKNFTINANFGAAAWRNITNKSVPRVSSFGFFIKPGLETVFNITVSNNFDTFTYTGTITAGTAVVNVKVLKPAGSGGGGTTPPPTATPDFALFNGNLTSGTSYRQTQNTNPWESQDILLSISAHFNYDPRLPAVFNANEIGISTTGLPPGTTLTFTPLGTSGSTVTYKGAIKNASTTPISSGQYNVGITISRVSGTKIAKQELFSADSFGIFVEPKTAVTTTAPMPPGDTDFNKILKYMWASRPASFYQIKGMPDGTWSYAPITSWPIVGTVGKDANGVMWGIGIAGTMRDSLQSDTKDWPFLVEATTIKNPVSTYIECDFYMKKTSLPTGSSFYGTGSNGSSSNPWFIPNPDWQNYSHRSNERRAEDIVSVNESIVKFMSGNMYNPMLGTVTYMARGIYLDYLIFPKDINQAGTMQLTDFRVSIGGFETAYYSGGTVDPPGYTPPVDNI